MRFPPGSFVTLASEPGLVYEVIRAWRLIESPSEWIYQLMARQEMNRIFKPTIEPTPELHEVWYEPRYRSPDFDHGLPASTVRTMRNQDMLRLAEHWFGDIMDS